MCTNDNHGSLSSIRLLLIGPREEDFFTIRDLLVGSPISNFELDHASTSDAVVQKLDENTYDLLLVQRETDETVVARVLKELRSRDRSLPLLVLAEHSDEDTLADALRGAFCECIGRDELSRASFLRILRRANNAHRREQEFEETLRKLHSAVEQSADMVIITSADGTIEYVNPAFEQTTGYLRSEVVGANPRLLKSGEHTAEFYRDLWNTLLSGQVFRGVMINRRKTGESLVVEKTITPVRNAQGVITRFICNDRDISEVRKLETALFQAQKMDAVGLLAGGIAHDFNNLLMVIGSYAELGMNDTKPDQRLHRYLSEILGASRRAADLTRQLLAFGRKQMQCLQVVDLNSILQNILRLLPRLIGEDIELRLFPQADPASVRVDPGQIEQVIMNLATNARHAMPNGGTYTLETRNLTLDDSHMHAGSPLRAGDYVLLEVSDTGVGISPEHLPHIFEPFYTTKEQGKGTGLGLATVYGIVKQSGGFIWAYSEVGLGTTFKIYFPTVRDKIRPIPVKDGGIHGDLRGTETVLLVEDEDALRTASSEFLAQHGYRVLQAANAQDALTQLEKHDGTVHALITDVVMPGVSGTQLARTVVQSHSQIKVLFISGYSAKLLADRGVLEAGAGFLQKPFSMKQLVAKLRELLRAEQAAATHS